MEDYRVQLDFYDGPMDLLLYLVRKDEVDIQDIPIARITEQYCRYVEMLRAIDINLAGEFLVMAAWLIEIKTRLLLPSTLPAADSEAGEPQTSAAEALADPRAELVRQLLAYKQFKDLADGLGEAAAEQALKHPRAGIDWKQIVGDDVEPALDLADVQIWDLFEAFGRLMEATGRSAEHKVQYDETPIHEHQADIIDRLTTGGPIRFETLFEGRGRSEIVGLFLALLELVRQKRIRFQQSRAFGTIVMSLRDPNEAPAAPAVPSAPAGPEQPAPDAQARRPRRRKDDQPVGVTWVDPDEDESLDAGLKEIDRQLRAINIPPDPDTLANGPAADPTEPPDSAETNPPPAVEVPADEEPSSDDRPTSEPA